MSILADNEARALRTRIADLEQQLADYASIQRTIDASKATVLEALDAAAAGRQRALHVLVDEDGWGGLLHVHDDLTTDLDGAIVPLIRWDIPMYRAETLHEALSLLTDLCDRLYVSEEAPGPWAGETSALADALEHLVRTGRAARSTEHGFLTLPPAEGDPGQ